MNKRRLKKKKRRYSQVLRQARKSIRKKVEKQFYLMSKHDVNHDSLSIPPLKKTDTLFIQNEDSEATNHLENDEIYFQNGYASAAALMLKLIMNSSDRYVRESYINPAMFCFRQFLELSMKDSILRYRHMRKEGNKSEPNIDGHNLVKLWEGLKQYLQNQDEEVECIGNLIKEFQNIDSGTAFRYNNYLLQTTDGKRVKIDVDIIYTRMLQMYRFFEGVNDDARNAQEENYD